MRILVLVVLALLSAAPDAAALEYHLVQWRKTDRCEIVTSLPLFGQHWIELGVFLNHWEAERELERVRKQGQCPAGRHARFDPYDPQGRARR